MQDFYSGTLSFDGLEVSTMHKRCQTHSFISQGLQGVFFDSNIKETIIGRGLIPVILRDPACPLLSWLMEGYPEN